MNEWMNWYEINKYEWLNQFNGWWLNQWMMIELWIEWIDWMVLNGLIEWIEWMNEYGLIEWINGLNDDDDIDYGWNMNGWMNEWWIEWWWMM